MKRLILDQEIFGLSNLLERIARVRVKDCFKGGEDEDTIYYVVSPGELGKAIGKGAANIKQLQNELNKKIKIIEFRDNVVDFVRNVIYPLTVEEIVEENGVLFIKDSNKKTKGLLIGRGGRNLKLINRAVQRFFNLEVKIV